MRGGTTCSYLLSPPILHTFRDEIILKEAVTPSLEVKKKKLHNYFKEVTY